MAIGAAIGEDVSNIDMKKVNQALPVNKESEKIPTKQNQAIQKYDYSVEILLAGIVSGAGKTSCITRFCENEFNSDSPHTIELERYIKILTINEKTAEVKIWDTSSQVAYRRLNLNLLAKTQAFIFIMDVTNRASIDLTRQEIAWVKNNSNKNTPILLISNKCDLETERKYSYEQGLQLAQELGAINYIECSSKENININYVFTLATRAAIGENVQNIKISKKLSLSEDLFVKKTEGNEDLSIKQNDYLLKTVLISIGSTMTGKSSCLTRLVDNTYPPPFMGTIGVDFGSKEYLINERLVKLQIWDTAGSEGYRTVVSSYLRDSSALVFFLDIIRKDSFDITFKDIKWAFMYLHENIPIFLIANKCDLKNFREFSHKEGMQFAYQIGASHYIECSAKENININEAFELIAKTKLDANEIDEINFELKNFDQHTTEKILNPNAPHIWHKTKAKLKELKNLQNALIIAALRKGLVNPYYFIRQSAAELLIHFGLADEIIYEVLQNLLQAKNNPFPYKAALALLEAGKINKLIILTLAKALTEPYVFPAILETVKCELKHIYQAHESEVLKVFIQRLESHIPEERYMAAEQLIDLKKIESYENKILYASGRNLNASHKIREKTKELLERTKKLNSIEVNKGFTDELNFSVNITFNKIEITIENNQFSSFCKHITTFLLRHLYGNKNDFDITKAKNLLQKILDEKLYGDNIQLKEYIEARVSFYDTKRKAVFYGLNVSRLFYQMQRNAVPENHVQYFNHEIIKRIIEQLPEVNLLGDSIQENIIRYADNKETLRATTNTKINFWQNICGKHFFTYAENPNEWVDTGFSSAETVNSIVNNNI